MMVTEVYAQKLDQIKEDARLSRHDVAAIVGANERTVFRWASGRATPRGEARDKLLELAVVAQRAARVMKPDVVHAWLYEPNHLLGYEKPVRMIAEGRYREVIGAIDALGEGVFV